ncbi:MAG: PEP-CTERM-box response regulator transcription factor [Gammaproteobacteria bacterium]|nr:PEP-CTERM-box response regulator transcription factor [Gammaproteobacteria bacterium]
MGKVKNKLKTLLVIEDDQGIQSQLRWCFDDYKVLMAEDRASAVELVKQEKPAVITLDLGLPPDPENASEGLAALEEILSIAPETKVIVVTGNDDRENAVKAIGAGAYDFYQKPIDAEILSMIIDRAYEVYELEKENSELSRFQINSPLGGIITSSPQMMKVCQTIEKVSPTNATVLIEGESGTGKELVARALHDLSARSSENFVAINCAAIPETLLESELFGYEKGAFTGAAKTTLGKIETAQGGTFFLDEVGDLPMSLQVKLLRFLQERIIERVGGRKEIPVDVRVVCATHRHLDDMIKSGSFREDLYYRISELPIRIPSLRERPGDSVLLARFFLEKYAKEQGRTIRGYTKDALRLVERYEWPGNVRELENKIKRAVIMCESKQIRAEDIDINIDTEDEQELFNLKDVRENAERMAIIRALGVKDGNVSQAAELLGITRPTLYTLLNKYGMKA